MHRLSVFILFLVGCPEPTEEPTTTTDLRIDNAAVDNDPDSYDTRMCTNPNGNVFVVWVDDRDGDADVWFNRSVDAGRSWMPSAVKVNHGPGNTFNPGIACTNDGVYIAWEDDRNGDLENHDIYLNRSTADVGNMGETWQGEDTLLEGDDEGISMSLGPSVAAIGSNVYVAWMDNLNGSFDIFVASSENQGKKFSEPIRADGDSGGEAWSGMPKIKATPDNVFVVWEDTRDGASDIYMAVSRNNGSSFRENKRIDRGDSKGQNQSFAPSFDVDDDVVYVVWHDERNGEGNDVMMNYSSDFGDTWLSNAERLDTDNIGVFDSLYPDIDVVGEAAHICWSDKSTSDAGYDIYYRMATQGSLQGEMTRVNTDPVGFFNHTSCKVSYGDETGVVVAWQDARDDLENEGFSDLYYNHSKDGVAWAESDKRIDNTLAGKTFKLDVNVDLFNSELLVSWTDARNGTMDVYFQHLQIGQESDFTPVEE
jgi:hypothetical protein